MPTTRRLFCPEVLDEDVYICAWRDAPDDIRDCVASEDTLVAVKTERGVIEGYASFLLQGEKRVCVDQWSLHRDAYDEFMLSAANEILRAWDISECVVAVMGDVDEFTHRARRDGFSTTAGASSGGVPVVLLTHQRVAKR